MHKSTELKRRLLVTPALPYRPTDRFKVRKLNLFRKNRRCVENNKPIVLSETNITEYLHPELLRDPRAYAEAERFWQSVWEQVDPFRRLFLGWESPWLATDGLDGNPIFTAWSPIRRLGLRVIEFEPQRDSDNLQFWLDSFDAPLTINELVIAVAPRRDDMPTLIELIEAWLSGELPIVPAANKSI